MRDVRRPDHDVPRLDDERLDPELERGLSRVDHEHLGIWVSMELRADAGLRVHEDDRKRDVPVLGTDELVGVPGVVEVIQLDDLGSGWHVAGA
jgi:hypothetical protein